MVDRQMSRRKKHGNNDIIKVSIKMNDSRERQKKIVEERMNKLSRNLCVSNARASSECLAWQHTEHRRWTCDREHSLADCKTTRILSV